jgi:hypothetical protein
VRHRLSVQTTGGLARGSVVVDEVLRHHLVRNRGTSRRSRPTGQHVEVRSLQVGKFNNGLMVERRSTDILGILSQLGLYP